jgi:hypothetical protein
MSFSQSVDHGIRLIHLVHGHDYHPIFIVHHMLHACVPWPWPWHGSMGWKTLYLVNYIHYMLQQSFLLSLCCLFVVCLSGLVCYIYICANDCVGVMLTDVVEIFVR